VPATHRRRQHLSFVYFTEWDKDSPNFSLASIDGDRDYLLFGFAPVDIPEMLLYDTANGTAISSTYTLF